MAHLSLSRTLESPCLRLHSIRLHSRPQLLQRLLARTSLLALLTLVLLPLLAQYRQHRWWSLPRLPFRLRLQSWICLLLLPLGRPHPNQPPQMAPSPWSLTRNARLRHLLPQHQPLHSFFTTIAAMLCTQPSSVSTSSLRQLLLSVMAALYTASLSVALRPCTFCLTPWSLHPRPGHNPVYAPPAFMP